VAEIALMALNDSHIYFYLLCVVKPVQMCILSSL